MESQSNINELCSMVEFVQGDITELKVDVIVNSADESMVSYVGVTKKINDICEGKVEKYLNLKFKGINEGSVVKTPGFKLKCKKIIHAVGPLGEKPEILSSIYTQCLDYCCNKGFQSIAFPCISVGSREYPREKACICALETTLKWLEKYRFLWSGKITFCCYDSNDYKTYQKYFTLYFPKKTGPITIPITEEEKQKYELLIETEKTMKKFFDYSFFHVNSYEEAMKNLSKTIKKKIPDIPEYPKPNNETPYTEKLNPENFDNSIENIRFSIIGTILGHAIGDAIGLSTQLLDKQTIFSYYGISHINYNHYYFDRHRMKWMDNIYICNDWTDDTDQMILILDSLIKNNGNLNILDFAKRCKFWITCGFVECGDLTPCDVDKYFAAVVDDNNFVNDPLKTSEEIWRRNNCANVSNGSIMRTSAVALFFFWDVNKVIENAKKFSLCTHFDPRCTASVVTVVSIISLMMKQEKNDIKKIINDSINNGEKELKDENEKKEFLKFCNVKNLNELNLNEDVKHTYKPMACGILCLQLAEEMCKKREDKEKIFEKLIEDVAFEGRDADTNCAVVGSILGCYLKVNFIKEEWMKLRNIKMLEGRINNILKFYNLDLFEIELNKSY